MQQADLELVALLGANLRYLEEIEARYRENPQSVDPGFAALLQGRTPPPASPSGGASAPATRPAAPPTQATVAGHPPTPTGVAPHPAVLRRPPSDVHRLMAAEPDPGLPYKLERLGDAFRRYGHMLAHLDPLELTQPVGHPLLEPTAHGLSISEPAVSVELARLRSIYSGSLGVEFMHISDPEKQAFIASYLENTPNRFVSDKNAQLHILDCLISAGMLERFIHTKYVSAKRFSLQGGKTLVALIDCIIENAGSFGTREVVIGMAHRGRLNVLANIMGKQPRLIFAEFDDIDPTSVMGSGDVKYHMGYSSDHTTRSGHTLHLSLAFNPSHLEAVDPVVVGRVRAKQHRYGDTGRKQVLGVLVHGDAAFSGQGLVAETLNLSGLEGYRTGGTVHVIVNNQIGFTTNPSDSRSTLYCTDMAKMLEVPIFHINANQPEQVAYAAELAMAYRNRFHTDIILDLICYRRYGHNEADEPSFTQPLMYQKIEKMPSVDHLYAQSLMDRGVLTQADVDGLIAKEQAWLEDELVTARKHVERPKVEWMTGVWKGYHGGADASVPDPSTAVELSRLHEISRRMTTVPSGFHPHPKIERLLAQRAAMGRGEHPLDWGMGEALAFGSLLLEKVPIRLSGQDSRRGTFSHRHAVLFDHLDGKPYTPLAHLTDQPAEQGTFRVYDSMLSEAAVLGFEYGYSLDYPDSLVIWEAQFGDFVNGAQVLLDQFVSSAEDKWRRLSGLVMLLPHGYEGQGPEHSSARFERFLQLCAEDNMQVVYPTTPAQFFHLLRRQVLRPWRKPLVVMSPKSLLRHPVATSTIDELVSGRFAPIIGDASVPAEGVTRILLCTGKVYYDLVDFRKKRNDTSTAIVRIEQLYPLRTEELKAALVAYPRAAELVWVQEEPANMGAQSFILPRLLPFARGRRFRAVSRVESASPATGSYKAHLIEQQALLEDAFADAVPQKGDKDAPVTSRPTVTQLLSPSSPELASA